MKKSGSFLSRIIFVLGTFFISCSASGSVSDGVSVIFCIGDGMGFEQVKAASFFLSGGEDGMVFSSFPVRGSISTFCADDPVTDSAAAATAFATGVKVNRGVVSKRIPGNGASLLSLPELFRNRGAATGIVTTSALTHATPAAFTAHVSSRNEYSRIATQMLYFSRPRVLFGGGGDDYSIDNDRAANAGYAVVSNASELSGYSGDGPVCGVFSDGHLPYEAAGYGATPHLSQMVAKALDVLDKRGNFFLLVEGARIDHAGHASDIGLLIPEMVEFNRAVETILVWMASSPRTVVLIVTADHETGGLQVTANNGPGVIPEFRWTSGGAHTGVNVPFYVYGQDAQLFGTVSDNTEFFQVLRNVTGY